MARKWSKKMFLGGMDSDTDEKLIAPEDYIDAENVRVSIDKNGKSGVVKCIPSTDEKNKTSYSFDENGNFQNGIGIDANGAGFLDNKFDYTNWRKTSTSQSLLLNPKANTFGFCSRKFAEGVNIMDKGGYWNVRRIEAGNFNSWNEFMSQDGFEVDETSLGISVLFQIYLPINFNNQLKPGSCAFDKIDVYNSFLKINPDVNNDFGNLLTEDMPESSINDSIIGTYLRVSNMGDVISGDYKFWVADATLPGTNEMAVRILFSRKIILNGYFNDFNMPNFDVYNTLEDITSTEGAVVSIDENACPVLAIRPDNNFGITGMDDITTTTISAPYPCWIYGHTRNPETGVVNYGHPSLTPNNYLTDNLSIPQVENNGNTRHFAHLNQYGVSQYLGLFDGNSALNKAKYGVLRQVLVKPKLMGGNIPITLGSKNNDEKTFNYCENFTVIGSCADNTNNKIYYFVTGDFPSGTPYGLPTPSQLSSPEDLFQESYNFQDSTLSINNYLFADWQEYFPDLINADIYTMNTLLQNVMPDDFINEAGGADFQNMISRTGYYDKDFILEYDPNYRDPITNEKIGSVNVVLVDGLEVVTAVPNDNLWDLISGNLGETMTELEDDQSPIGQTLDYDANPSYTIKWAHKKVLNFNKENPVQANYVDGMLYFTDGINAPKKINIKKAKIYSENVRNWTYTNPNFYGNYIQGGYGYTLDSFIQNNQATIVNTLKLQHTDAVKYPPKSPIVFQYATDVNRKKNNVFHKVFQFKYRYVYENNETSAFSPTSKLAQNWIDKYSTQESEILSTTAANYIKLNLERGDPSIVKGIEIAVKEVAKANTGQFYIAASFDFDKNRDDIYCCQLQNLGEGVDNNVNYISSENILEYKFYNDSILTAVPDIEDSPAFDNLPLVAKTQDFVENRIVYGNIKEGFNNVSVVANMIPKYLNAPTEESFQVSSTPELLNIIANGVSNLMSTQVSQPLNGIDAQQIRWKDLVNNFASQSDIVINGQNLTNWVATEFTYNIPNPPEDGGLYSPNPVYQEDGGGYLYPMEQASGYNEYTISPAALDAYPFFNYANGSIAGGQSSQITLNDYVNGTNGVSSSESGGQEGTNMIGCIKLGLANSYGPGSLVDDGNINNISDQMNLAPTLNDLLYDQQATTYIEYSIRYRLYFRSAHIETWAAWNTEFTNPSMLGEDAQSFYNSDNFPEGYQGNFLFSIDEDISGAVTYGNSSPDSDTFLDFLVEYFNASYGGTRRVFSRINPYNMRLSNLTDEYKDNEIYCYINMGQSAVQTYQSEINTGNDWPSFADSFYGSYQYSGITVNDVDISPNQNIQFYGYQTPYSPGFGDVMGFAGISMSDSESDFEQGLPFLRFTKGAGGGAIGSFKAGAHHKFGLVYYDRANRSSSVMTQDSLSPYVKFFSERSGARNWTWDDSQEGLGPVEMHWEIRHKPPIWATHYQWVYSKNRTVKDFLQLPVWGSFKSLKKKTDAFLDVNGETVIDEDVVSADSIFLHIGSFKNGGMYNEKTKTFAGTSLQERCPLIDYEFMEGDRVRIIASARHNDAPLLSGQSVNGTTPPIYYDFKVKSIRNYHWKNVQHGHNRYETGDTGGDGANNVDHKIENIDIWCQNQKWNPSDEIKNDHKPFYSILNCGWIVEIEDPKKVQQQHTFTVAPYMEVPESTFTANYQYSWEGLKKRDDNAYSLDGFNSFNFPPHQNAWFQEVDSDGKSNAPAEYCLHTNTFIEIYRPNMVVEGDENVLYYEIGEKYNIAFPHRNERFHEGPEQDQSILPYAPASPSNEGAKGVLTRGDVWFRWRKYTMPHPVYGVFNSDQQFQEQTPLTVVENLDNPELIPGVQYWDVYQDTYLDEFENDAARTPTQDYYRWGSQTRDFFIESYFYNDYFMSHACDIGRPNMVVQKSKEESKSASIMNSLPYVQDTKVNGLSAFPFTSNYTPILDLDLKYGNICKILGKETDLVVFQQDRVTIVLINKNIISTTDGEGQVGIASNFLGQPSPIPGFIGCVNPESVVKFNEECYFVDKDRKKVYSLGAQGLVPISDIKMSLKFKEVLGYENTDISFIFGSYDPVIEEYIITICKNNVVDYNSGTNVINSELMYQFAGNTGNPVIPTAIFPTAFNTTFKRVDIEGLYTYAFSKKNNRWVTRYTYYPENKGVFLDNKFYTPFGGFLHLHNELSEVNTFYDTNEKSKITFSHNEGPSNVKTYNAISLESNEEWDCESIETNIASSGTNFHFVKKEGEWFSDIPRSVENVNAESDMQLLNTLPEDFFKNSGVRAIGKHQHYNADAVQGAVANYFVLIVPNEIADKIMPGDKVMRLADNDTQFYYDGNSVVAGFPGNLSPEGMIWLQDAWGDTMIGDQTLYEFYQNDNTVTPVFVSNSSQAFANAEWNYVVFSTNAMGEKTRGNYAKVTLKTPSNTTNKKLFAVNFDVTDSKLHNK